MMATTRPLRARFKPVWLFAAVALSVGLVSAACSRPLENVGDASRRVVHGDSTTTTRLIVSEDASVLALRSSEAVGWFNSDLGTPVETTPAEVIDTVWERSNEVTAFIQASPDEIALSLPGVRFPEVIPDSVEFISSQLVYEVASGVLDLDTATAFGMWSATPYSVARDVGQIVVLRVGIPAAGELFNPGIAVAQVEEGLALSWVEGDYRYELFCRTGLDEVVCQRMAESMVPLAAIIP